MVQNRITSWDVMGKTVIVRIDGNVPIAHQQIADDHKLVASLATITYLLDHGAQLLLLADIGQSEQHHKITSCRYLVNWFNKEGLPVKLAASIYEAQQQLADGQRIIMLENLQLFPGEEQHDTEFARTLASMASHYVNDAFAALTSTNSSITLVPNFFDAQHTSIGFLIEHELQMLNQLAHTIKRPFLLFLGGKQEGKSAIIKALMPNVDGIYIGPALCFNFLKASGTPVGMSHINPDLFHDCHEITMLAQEHGVPLHFPLDYVIAETPDHSYYDLSTGDKLSAHEAGISIGPKTVAAWKQDCEAAQTIILHGLMGFLHKPEGLIYYHQLLQAIQYSSATRIITGSSTIAAAHLLDLATTIEYCSTGGNTTLAYLGKTPLPGLIALMNRTEPQ